MKKSEIEKLLKEVNAKLDFILGLLEAYEREHQQGATFVGDKLFDEYINGEKGNNG